VAPVLQRALPWRRPRRLGQRALPDPKPTRSRRVGGRRRGHRTAAIRAAEGL